MVSFLEYIYVCPKCWYNKAVQHISKDTECDGCMFRIDIVCENCVIHLVEEGDREPPIIKVIKNETN